MPSYFFLLSSLAFLCNSHNENPSARLTPSAQDMWRSRLLNLWGLQWLSGDDTDCIFLESSNSDVYDHFEGAVTAALHGLAAPARRSRCNSVKLPLHIAQSTAVSYYSYRYSHGTRNPTLPQYSVWTVTIITRLDEGPLDEVATSYRAEPAVRTGSSLSCDKRSR